MKNLEEISDNRLAGLLRKYLRAKSSNPSLDSLKNQKLCGSQNIDGRFFNREVSAMEKNVILIANDKAAKFYGTTHCHSPWCCPHCTPIVMAKKGRDIACAIDALASKYNQSACMITFTLPHTKYMSCKDTLEILTKTWRMFSRAGNKGYRFDTYIKKKSQGTSTYKKKMTAYGVMRQELNITHHVKTYEVTYGANSWHPHIHMLLWIPNDKFNDVINYEQLLLDRWWHCAEFVASKYYKETYPDKDYSNLIHSLFADWRKNPKTGHKSVFISKDQNGLPRKISSSIYISGWSGNYELTYYDKKARKGHFTPNQLLQLAYHANLKNLNDKFKFFMDLFIEFALATKGHRRVEFSSRSGISKIIAEWKLSNTYIQDMQKKITEKEAEVGHWKNIVYFTPEQWKDLLFLEDELNRDIRSDILELANQKVNDIDVLELTRMLITQHLANIGIDISNNEPFQNDDFHTYQQYQEILASSA